MKTADFEYDLPPELIAQEPLPERSASRMLVLHRSTGRMEHGGVRELPERLQSGDLIVVNDTRVIPARVEGQWRDTQGRVELLLVEETAPGEWTAMCRASRRARPGLELCLADGKLDGRIITVLEGGRISVRLSGGRPVLDILDEEGVPPVPPYVKRRPDDPRTCLDRARYQTVFARETGAVAAPTAGLHFSVELLDGLRRRGIGHTAVTLHVGPGTFTPVKCERVESHVMEQERYSVRVEAADAIDGARRNGGRVVAVGSTTVRTLETVAGIEGRVTPGSGRTGLFIRPPHRFRAVDALLTNFHLPRSSLLMMTAAFAGFDPRGREEEGGEAGPERQGLELIMKAYREAVRLRYRFYSYGDCMLIV
ncbi:tRNA preQ1(34) S-adenosylmethionine ribosyltransferase-isomerase QueA [Verrucomicrobiota bacterium]